MTVYLNATTNIPDPDAVFKKPIATSTKRARNFVLKEQPFKKAKIVQPLQAIVLDPPSNLFQIDSIRDKHIKINNIEGIRILESSKKNIILKTVYGKPKSYLVQDKENGRDFSGRINYLADTYIPVKETKRPPFPFNGQYGKITIEGNKVTCSNRHPLSLTKGT